MAPNIYCCGAGTAADTEAVTGKVLRDNGIEAFLLSFLSFNSFQTFSSFIYFRYGQLPATASPLCNWSWVQSCNGSYTTEVAPIQVSSSPQRAHANEYTQLQLAVMWSSFHHHLLMSLCFRYQGHVSAALVLGGVDCTGPHLHTVSNWV
jgi:hypothetical protein